MNTEFGKMITDYHIREFRDEDFPEMIRLWESLGLGAAHRGDDVLTINRTVAMGGRLLLLVNTSTDSIIGTSWLTTDGRRTYLHHFGIATEHQGKGLANMLLDASLKRAKTFGMQIKLEVHKDNAKALGLYAKAGFAYLGDYNVYIIRDVSIIN